jgi:hypothetical protein
MSLVSCRGFENTSDAVLLDSFKPLSRLILRRVHPEETLH